MRRGAVAWVSMMVLASCVGQNPWWDAPATGGSEGAPDDGLGESTFGDRGGDTGVDPTGVDATTGADSTGGTTILDVSVDGSASHDDGSGDDAVGTEGGTEGGTSTAGSAMESGPVGDEGPMNEEGGPMNEEGGPMDEEGGPMDEDEGSNDDGPPPCVLPDAICDGDCVDVMSHHHHCGVACIDCMDVYGPGTHCVDGVCDVD